MSYATLKTGIADYLHRTDLTAKIPGFITLAENFMFRELNLREIETKVTATASGATIPLPADFHTLVRITVTFGGREMTLANAVNNSVSTQVGMPASYSMEGNVFKLYPAPGTGYSYTLYYKTILAPLSDAVQTNWLETNAGDLYLYTSILEATRWTQNTALMGIVMPMIAPMLASVRMLSERKGLPQRGTMQIKPARYW